MKVYACPHEQLRGRCYHPSLAPWPGNCLDDDTCPGGLGPWGAWRSIEGWITRPFVNVEPGSLPWVRYGVLADMPPPPGLFGAVGWSA